MEIIFSAHGMYLAPEDDYDLEYLNSPLIEDVIRIVNLEMTTGRHCSRLSEYEAKERILYLYKEYLRQIVWELRNV